MAFESSDGGSISVQLDKTSFSPGETLHGKMRLDLKAPVKAKGLHIEFYAVRTGQRRVAFSKDQYTRFTKEESTATNSLSGEREYKPGEEFEFSITVPKKVDVRKNLIPNWAITLLEIFMPNLARGDYISGFYVQGTLRIKPEVDIEGVVEVWPVGQGPKQQPEGNI